MFLQLNAIVVDADPGNRAEMSAFLTQHGVHVREQLPGIENLAGLLQRGEAVQLVVVNLDPSPHDALKRIGHLPRQFPGMPGQFARLPGCERVVPDQFSRLPGQFGPLPGCATALACRSPANALARATSRRQR